MFDVKKVSAKIRDARIRKNMTQNNLADGLGVSYQAVSNWERGNSLPDISKYEDLCRILDVSMEFLLGVGSDTDTVNKLLDSRKNGETVQFTVKELTTIAPVLPPNDLEEAINNSTDKKIIHIEELKALAPFLDQTTLDQLAENVAPDSIYDLVELAPFLSGNILAELINKMDYTEEEIEMSFVIELAPFLERDMLEGLAENTVPSDIWELVGIAPFLSRSMVSKLVERLENRDSISFDSLVSLAPFLEKQVLEQLLEDVEVQDAGMIAGIAPFISQGTLSKLISRFQTAD